MEHRSHKRVSVCKSIEVAYPGGTTIAGTVRNVSRSGAYVELCTTDVPPNALVQLLIPDGGDSDNTSVRIPAAIVRRSRQGLGLLYFGRHSQVTDYACA